MYRLGDGTVEQIRAELTGSPHYSTVRALLRVLETKGYLIHGERDLRHTYRPGIAKGEAAEVAIDRVLMIFFDGSVEKLLEAVMRRAIRGLRG